MDAITIATIGNSDDLKVGAQVVAIGNALGYGQSVTTGIVSAKNRQLNLMIQLVIMTRAIALPNRTSIRCSNQPRQQWWSSSEHER